MSQPALISKQYQGHTFLFRPDGYFNMTKAAKAFGKRLENFWRTEGVRIYCCELAQALGVNDSDMSDLSYGLTEAKRGHNGGTWGHPKLAVFFARWLDVKLPEIYDGTVGIVAFEARPYFIPVFGMAGLVLLLEAVQIIELQTGDKRTAADYGFVEEEGWETPDQTRPSNINIAFSCRKCLAAKCGQAD